MTESRYLLDRIGVIDIFWCTVPFLQGSDRLLGFGHNFNLEKSRWLHLPYVVACRKTASAGWFCAFKLSQKDSLPWLKRQELPCCPEKFVWPHEYLISLILHFNGALHDYSSICEIASMDLTEVMDTCVTLTCGDCRDTRHDCTLSAKAFPWNFIDLAILTNDDPWISIECYLLKMIDHIFELSGSC